MISQNDCRYLMCVPLPSIRCGQTCPACPTAQPQRPSVSIPPVGTTDKPNRVTPTGCATPRIEYICRRRIPLGRLGEYLGSWTDPHRRDYLTYPVWSAVCIPCRVVSWCLVVCSPGGIAPAPHLPPGSMPPIGHNPHTASRSRYHLPCYCPPLELLDHYPYDTVWFGACPGPGLDFFFFSPHNHRPWACLYPYRTRSSVTGPSPRSWDSHDQEIGIASGNLKLDLVGAVGGGGPRDSYSRTPHRREHPTPTSCGTSRLVSYGSSTQPPSDSASSRPPPALHRVEPSRGPY